MLSWHKEWQDGHKVSLYDVACLNTAYRADFLMVKSIRVAVVVVVVVVVVD